MKLTLCTVQFHRGSGNPEINIEKMSGLLENISSPADIILLPEGWLGPQILEHRHYMLMLEELKKLLPPGALLVSGAHYVRCREGVISTGAFLNGAETTHYDKIFPSHAIGERNIIIPGTRQPLFVHRGITVAAVVCVDLFYPEIVRRLALRGASIIFNPANIPAVRMGLWHNIGITRAAENTVFLAMANNTGTRYPDGREVKGKSFIAGPEGAFFRDCGDLPGVYFTEIDLQLIEKARERWQYLADVQSLHR